MKISEIENEVLRYGIDTNIFYPSSKKQKKNEINIGFIGRFDDPRKNIKNLLKAYSLLDSKISKKYKLVIAGSLIQPELD